MISVCISGMTHRQELTKSIVRMAAPWKFFCVLLTKQYEFWTVITPTAK